MNEIILSTGKKPDYYSIVYFKKSIDKYLKKGFKLYGGLTISSDGSLIQKFIKA